MPIPQNQAPLDTTADRPAALPRERTFYWWIGWTVFWAVLLIGGFYVVENIRGRRAWEAYVASVTARGDSVTVGSAIPPEIPDEQNLAMTPLLRDVFMTAPGYKTPFGAKLEVMYHRRKVRLPEWPDWKARERFDFQQWSELFQKVAPISPVPPQEAPHETALRALAGLEQEIDELVVAARSRPFWRAPLNYEAAPDIFDPSWAFVIDLSRVLGLHAAALIKAGETAGAADEISFALRLSKDLKQAQLSSAIASVVMPSIWEGVWEHKWSDQQLRQLESGLGQVNFKGQLHAFVISQRNLMALPIIEKGRRDPRVHWNFAGVFSQQRAQLQRLTDEWIPGATWPLDLAIAVSALAPSGWHDQNKVSVGRANDALLAALAGSDRQFDVSKADAYEREAERLIRSHPSQYTQMLRPIFNFSQFVRNAAKAQADVELTRIAIALERHRLMHGSYPDSLGLIDPRALPAGGLPDCPVIGETAVYEKTEDDSFQLRFAPSP